MICKILLQVFTILIAIQFSLSKLQLQGNKVNTTARSLHLPVKKQNVTLNDKGTSSKLAMQMKRTIVKHHEGNRTIRNETSNNAVSRHMNIENFIENHKEAVVRLLKKLLLPKLKARALQSHSFERPLDTDPSNKKLDKEAMNYELGYFLGLQKAFKNRQMLMGDSGEDDLVPLKLTHKGGSNAAITESGPMTGFTSVALPFHKLKPHPLHETLDSTLSHYGMQDPGFLKKITKADERDILQFAGKHNMDVFAERNNLKGISDYLSKRNFISRPMKISPTNEAASQRIKKDDILRSYIFAEEPDKPRDDEPTARVETGPNPLDNVPTPLHRVVSQADHISTDEINGLLGESGEDKINMKELYGLIENEEKAKERLEDQDKSPQIGTVFGEDTNVQAENGFKNMPSQQEISVEELDKADNGQGESEVGKRTLNGLLSIVQQNEYEEERNELRHVLRKIIDKLSEIPNYNQKRKRLQYPYYRDRGLINRAYIPYYYNPVYRTIPIRKLWKRSMVPRPKHNMMQKRTEIPHENDVAYGALKTSDNINDYAFQSESNRPPDLEETGGVEAYALPKTTENPRARLENFLATPKEESLGEAIALLNRGSSIDDSLGDHLQAGFLQQFVLPNTPPTLYKRNSLKMPRQFKVKSRNKRSIDLKKSVKAPKKKKVVSKSKKHHGKKKTHQSEANNTVKTMRKETNSEVTSVGSKKHEILRDPTIPILSGLDSYISPAVFESKSQNFFTSGPRDNSRIINQMGAGTVLLSGPNSGIGTVRSNPKFHSQHVGQRSNENYQHKSRYLEQFIANPRMSAFRSPSYQTGHTRSGFVGNRHISPALEIYNDNSVSSNGDLPVMEVQSMRPNGAMPGQIGSEQAMQEETQGSPDVAQVGNIATQNGVDTDGQGSIEMSSKYEVLQSPGVQDGNMQLLNGDSIAQQNSQVIEDPKGDEHTGTNSMAVEEISGETKQAISNTLAALDKQSVGQARMENHHQPFLMGGETLEHSSSSAETPIYDERLAAHPLSDHNIVQTLNQASKGLDEEVLLGSSAHHLTENKVPSHVYLPNEDFDGIDWRKLHQPVHGPLGNDATSKEEIQLLSDPFFAPGVGEPIGDHSKPPIVSPITPYNLANHISQQTNTKGSQIVLSTPSVVDVKTAPSALLTADAVNTVKAITNAGVIQAVPGSTAAVSTNVPAVSNAPTAAVNSNAAANLAAAQIGIAANQTTAPLLSTAEQQLHAHEHAVHELHKEIVSNAEISAAQTGTAMANAAQKATNAHYIADVKNAAIEKLKDNNEHAAQLHQLGNTVAAQNTNVAAKATEYLNNAAVAAAHDVQTPVSPSVGNVTSNIPIQPLSPHGVMNPLEEPYLPTVQTLENEANKAADLHHDTLHMGTYINQEAAHSLNSNSVSNVLSHDHIDENMHTPAILGNWHSMTQLHHDAYPYHWNHIELEAQPQVIDMSPMTPGGIHFMTSTPSNNLGANAANAVAANANAAGANAASANAASANAASANAANAVAANANAAGTNAASANAASANAANAVAANANAASANAANANAANAAAANANAIAASSTGAAVQPGAVAGVAVGSKGASNDFIGGKTEASNIGSSGGMMKQGTNVVKGAGSTKATVASKDDISGNGMKDGYPDISTTDNDKRNVTNNEESFDNDTSKKGEQKEAKNSQENQKTDENNSDENSGFDASTASSANEDGGSEISFDTTKYDDFQMENSATKEGSKLDGKATMEFNQTQDEDASGAGIEQLNANNSLEEPMIESDDKTASLQLGNLKESKVQDFADSATATSEIDDNFVTESDTQDKGKLKEGEAHENGMDADANENGESRSGGKTSKLHKTLQKGEFIQSDEAIRGNRYKSKGRARLRSKENKAMSYKHLTRPLQRKVKVGKKHAASKKRVHTPIVKLMEKSQPSRIKGNSGKSTSTITAAEAKLSNSTEFFIGNGMGKHAFKNKMEKSYEVRKQNAVKGHAKDVSSKHRNSSEFFLIKTNNLTEAEPTSEESLFTKNDSNNEFITGEKKTIVDDLADFQLSDSAKKHLLPGDLEKLAKLHRMLSMAQINLLKKEKPEEVKGMVRTLKPNGHVENVGKGKITGQYRSAINEALKQIEGVRKSLINQEGEQDSGKLPKNGKYRAAIHEALKEVEAVKKSLLQSSSSSTKLLTNALAISNLANLLRESTNIFNKAYGAISKNYPNVAANMVTGDLISPGTSGVLINPAVKTSSQQNQQLPDLSRKSTKDIYAEIGSPAMVEEENSEKKSLKRHPITTHMNVKHPGIRTIKETKRQQIGKN